MIEELLYDMETQLDCCLRSAGPHTLDMIPGRFGVAQERLSGYEKFEGLDPAVWTIKGYAIVNVDIRGTWDSEGTIP